MTSPTDKCVAFAFSFDKTTTDAWAYPMLTFSTPPPADADGIRYTVEGVGSSVRVSFTFTVCDTSGSSFRFLAIACIMRERKKSSHYVRARQHLEDRAVETFFRMALLQVPVTQFNVIFFDSNGTQYVALTPLASDTHWLQQSYYHTCAHQRH